MVIGFLYLFDNDVESDYHFIEMIIQDMEISNVSENNYSDIVVSYNISYEGEQYIKYIQYSNSEGFLNWCSKSKALIVIKIIIFNEINQYQYKLNGSNSEMLINLHHGYNTGASAHATNIMFSGDDGKANTLFANSGLSCLPE